MADPPGSTREDRGAVTYRPVACLDEGRVVGLVARTAHPVEGGSDDPGALAVLAEVLGLLAGWQHEGGCPALAVHVPVSVGDLTGPMAPGVAALLARHGVRPSTVVLEVSERAFTHGGTADLQQQALRAQGVRLAVGRLGTQAVAFAHLRRRPVDLLTVDVASGTLLGGILHERTAAAVVRELSEALGVPVLAEGVACEEHLAPAVAMGCTFATGPLFGAPVPADAVPPVLALPPFWWRRAAAPGSV